MELYGSLSCFSYICNHNSIFFGCRLPSPVSMTYESRSPDGSSGVLTGPGYTESTTRANYKVNISSINTRFKSKQAGPCF